MKLDDTVESETSSFFGLRIRRYPGVRSSDYVI